MAWASRQYGLTSKVTFEVNGVEKTENIRLFHIHGGEFLAFHEESQLAYEKGLKEKADKKEDRFKVKAAKKARKIGRELCENPMLREFVEEDLGFMNGRRDE